MVNIESSYRENNLGKILYDVVLFLRPKKIVEFGTLYGYSTVCMGLALKRLGRGELVSYDLYERYPYTHGNLEEVKLTVQDYHVHKFVKLGYEDYDNWLEGPEPFDLLHLDISNDGQIIQKTYTKLLPFLKKGSVVVFEGGSRERDEVGWMKKFSKTPINPLKTEIPFRVLTDKFPSISIINLNENGSKKMSRLPAELCKS